MNQLYSSQHLPAFAKKFAHEMIGVCKIKLRRPSTQTMAVLSCFISADKLLRDWAADVPGSFECDFQIHYLDGSELSGRIARRRGNRGCLSLGAFVRQAIMEIGNTAPETISILRFERRLGGQGTRSEAVDSAFLCTYEIEDFGSVDSTPLRVFKAEMLSS